MTYLPSILIGTEVLFEQHPANKLVEVAVDRFSAKNSERVRLFVLVGAQGRYAAQIKEGRAGEHLQDERVRARKWRIAL